MLNFKLLAVCICIIIALTLYLFYWNRFIGFVISRLLRLFLWGKGKSSGSVWVDIGSIHLSLLAGRILVKDVTYHSSNQTLRIVKGQVSWRYWIRAPAGEEDLSHAKVVGEDIGMNSEKSPLSCRLHISLQGLEWFIYNRTTAYDDVVNAMDGNISRSPDGSHVRVSGEGIGSLRKIFSWTSVVPESTHLGPPVSLVSSIYSRTPQVLKNWGTGIRNQLPNLDPKDLLPIGIEVTKGAFVIGNASTPELLVAEFRNMRGTYGIVPARSKYDQYKQVLSLVFHSATLSFAENKNFGGRMIAVGEKLHAEAHNPSGHPMRSFSYLSFSAFAKLWRRAKLWNIINPRSQVFHGLMHNAGTWPRRRPRGKDTEETPLGINFTTLEYAKEPKILEAPMLELLYYADSVGEVPRDPEREDHPRLSEDPFDIGNGDLPPEWGVDIGIRGGVLRYGPWTDRQRATLQQAFFPPSFTDATPVTPLRPGEPRRWTCMKILVELRDGVMLQIPFREPSKNWQWDGEVNVPNRPRKREAASVHVRAGDNSTISYMMPMIATAAGYQPTLHVHLDTVTITSSLNDIRILTADSCGIRAELPSPLKWNAERQWTFAISLRQPVFYLLRDHINMFTDLSKDWASGPPADYERFIPMLYKVEIDLHNYELNTYVNDHNIIDKPLIKEENGIMTLYGKSLHTNVMVPLVRYRPETTTVSFDIAAPDIHVRLTLPRWNTRSLYSAPHRNTDIGRVGMLRLNASYSYFAEVHPENIDQLKLSFETENVVYKAYGWSIRHFMILRNNYFGSFTHFSTLYEYLEKRKQGQPLGDPVDLQYREGSSNSLQIELDVSLMSGLAVMPAGMRGYELDQADGQEGDIGTCVLLSLPELQVHLRSNEYYMELSLNQDTIVGSVHDHCPEDLRFASQLQDNVKETFVIDGLDVLANRLFGPQPHAATYLCIWDIHIGRIMGHLGTSEWRVLLAAGQSFGLNFSDPLNAPAAEYEIPGDPDVTFLKIVMDEITFVWHADNAAVELRLPHSLRMDSNDLAGKHYSKVTSVRIPDGSMKMLLGKTSAPSEWLEAAEVTFDAFLDNYSAPLGWRERAEAQAQFLAKQDGHTCRAVFLYMPDQTVPNDTLAPGRGVVDTDLYLPQLRIPNAHASARAAPHARRATQNLRPLHTRMKSRARAKSDSEGEENISEADRDARLAKSRPPPIPRSREQDEESISSGDEEDDFSTVSYSSSSDDEGDHVQDAWPDMKDYWTAVPRYDSSYLAHPSYWHKSPFYLARDMPRSNNALRDTLAQWFCEDPSEADLEDARLEFDDEYDTSILRVTTSKPTNIRLTPLILPVVDKLLADVKDNQLDTMLRIDFLIGQHIRSVLAQTQARKQASAIDLHLSSLHLNVLQSVVDRNDLTGRDIPMPAYRTKTLLAFDTMVNNLRLRTNKTTNDTGAVQSQALVVDFGMFACAVDAAGAVELPWHFFAGPSKFSLIRGDLQLSLGSIYTNTQQNAPEHFVPIVEATIRLADRLRTSFSSYAGYSQSTDQNLIVELIKLVGNRTAVDPLSTTQPSYLIQSGRPREVRTNTGFKYLVFLRRYLESCNNEQRQLLHHASMQRSPESSWDDAFDILQSFVTQFGADMESLTFPPGSPLEFLLSAPGEDGRSPSSSPVQSVSLVLRRIHALYTSPDGNNSEVVLAAAVVNARMRTTEWHEPHHGGAHKSSTTLSLGEKAGQSMQHVSIILSLGDVAISFYPSLITFAQHVIRVTKRTGLFKKAPGVHTPSTPVVSSPVPDSKPRPPVTYVEFVLSSNSFKVKAGAQNLVIEYRALGVDFVCTSLLKPATPKSALDLSMNHSLVFKEARLQGCALADMSKPDEYAVLAALISSGGKLNVLVHYQSDANPFIRVALGLDGLQLNVPRSAIRLYRFTQEWREDYLPGIEETFRSLLAELRPESGSNTPIQAPSKPRSPSSWLPRNVEVVLGSFRVSLQVMRGTWIAWEIGGIMAYLCGASSPRESNRRNFGMQIGYHTFIVSSKNKSTDPTPSVRVKLPLPTFTATGLYDGIRLDGLILIDTFTVNVKPSHWDTLLTVQQKFGQDFSDLVSLIEDTRLRTPKGKGKKEEHSSSTLQYRLQGKMKGFSIGLEGGSSAIFLECDRIGGAVVQNGSGISGHIELSDLALSLAPHSDPSSPIVSFDRSRRSAFVIIDLLAEMGESKEHKSQLVNLAVTKIHAVMQPSSIGQIGDFIDHLQAEISVRQEQRAQDLAEFKEKTKALLRSLELTTSKSRSESLSWLDKYIIKVAVKNIGVAFPLAAGEDLQKSRQSKQSEHAVRAFLFSIESIAFDAHRGRSGKASMKGFSFQFVSRFRQSEPLDFAGHRHITRNRVVYPEMTAQLKAERKANARELHIAADVDGFVLDIDSSIPDYVSSLIDVYREGKDRMDRFSGVSNRSAEKEIVPPKDAPEESRRTSEDNYNGLLTSHVFLALSFKSGRVRMFSNAYSASGRPRVISTPSQEPLDRQLGDHGSEIFDLPGLSVWGEYRATPASHKLGGRKQAEPSTLVFKSTIHSSQNTLRPSLLPFITEVINHVEARMKKTSRDIQRANLSSPVTPLKQIESPQNTQNQVQDSVSSLQISLSLRIDQSRLELTCQPDVNVIAGLHWDSGGFVVNISPGAHRVTFSGNVGGLTVGLKHGFLSEDCVSLHARNLAFSVDFAKARGATVSSVSIACDTEFSGGVRFSRLQDVLCFKAVWLDRIPVLSMQPATPAPLSSRTPSQMTASTTSAPKQELATAVLFRLRKVSLDIDLGQSISAIKLDVKDAILRTKVTEMESEVSLSVRELVANASGNLSGRITAPDFLFQTIRKKERMLRDSSKSTMLDLHMTSGPLDVALDSEYQKLLLYRAEPLVVRIYDDWSLFAENVDAKDRQVRLTFTVKGSDVTAVMNVGTIPKLVSYANKFKATLDAQKEGASRESQAFRQSNPSKPENPLSDVANAMLSSARTRLAEADLGFACIIGQRLSLKLRTLRLVIFPRSMRDPELAQFVGSNVHARLDRFVESELRPPKRDLHLSFSYISISRLGHLNFGLVAKEEPTDTARWLIALTKDATEATIFTLPTMDMRMHTEEFVEGGSRILPYEFSSKFVKTAGTKEEDIYITLNMSLYAWLTILRKTFAREMEQVQASTEARAPTIGLSQPASLRRSKVPEPLNLSIDKDRDWSRNDDSLDELMPGPKRAGLPHIKSTPARYSLFSPTSDSWTIGSPPQSPAPPTAKGPAIILNDSPTEMTPRAPSPGLPSNKKAMGIVYRPQSRTIERLTMRQLGEATPDVMHPFFMKTAGFSLEDSLPQYVHEYATMPTEEIMKALLKLYSKQLREDTFTGPNS